MKISYAVTVCNELTELKRLFNFLLDNMRQEDEIIILFDSVNGSVEVEQFIKSTGAHFYPYKFDGNFSKMKNYLTSLCTGDYIYQIDADEMLNEYILRLLPQVLQQNDVDVLLVPRINTVEGLTQQHIDKWGWRVDENGWVNFPDYQWRIYKNNKNIKWKNKVHEVLDGYKTMSHLPTEKEWCLIHEKTIKRQEMQNEYYNTL